MRQAASAPEYFLHAGIRVSNPHKVPKNEAAMWVASEGTGIQREQRLPKRICRQL